MPFQGCTYQERVFTILGKKLQQIKFIANALYKLVSYVDVTLTVCEPHISFLALGKIPAQKFQAIMFYGFTHTSMLVAFN